MSSDEFTIPRPKYATDLAFCKASGKCLGIVVRAEDKRQRAIPQWLTMSAHLFMLFDGVYIQFRESKTVRLEWVMD